ncbi:MAG: Bug family tripartite tricarboxylate transporter substrate binding protein [Lautropia sp.]
MNGVRAKGGVVENGQAWAVARKGKRAGLARVWSGGIIDRQQEGRRMIGLRHVAAALCVALPLMLQTAVAAYPERPVKLVVPFPPGGGTDATARLIANSLSGELQQQVVVENRAGAAGAIGAQAVVDAAPDGYTLFFATTGTLTINQHLYASQRYDPLTDFTPVAMVASFPNVLVVHPAVAANSVSELIELAKRKPGALTYGSSGAGSSSHLAAVLLEQMTGARFTHVPYRGSAPMTVDLLGGRIDFIIDNITTNAQHAKQGKVRALGVTGTRPSPLLPGVPTIAEAGVPGYDVTIWYAIVGPAKMPSEITNRLSDALGKVMATPAIKESLARLGTDPWMLGPKALGQVIRDQSAKWGETVKRSGAKAE